MMVMLKRRMEWCLQTLIGAAFVCLAGDAVAQEPVRPSLVDPAVREGDTPYLVYNSVPADTDAPLVVFLPGTNGTAAGAPRLLLRMLADQGYRVIYLSYDDRVAATNICPRAPPGCFAEFRAARLFGGTGPVPTPPAEAIVPRLIGLLHYLDHEHPEVGWGRYLTPQGPAWPRIVMSGLSQGAGMAAYLAKRYPLQRVVLFSSPWDFRLPGRRPAPWLFDNSATPPARWWAERHVRENTSAEIARAYDALHIPRSQILLFDGPPPPGATGKNPFHGSTVKMAQYMPQWRAMYGLDQPRQ